MGARRKHPYVRRHIWSPEYGAGFETICRLNLAPEVSRSVRFSVNVYVERVTPAIRAIDHRGYGVSGGAGWIRDIEIVDRLPALEWVGSLNCLRNRLVAIYRKWR